MSVRFSNKLVAELFQPFWAALQAGEFLTDAAAIAHTSPDAAPEGPEMRDWHQVASRPTFLGWVTERIFDLLDDDRHDNRCRRESGVGAAYGRAGGAGL